MLTERLKDLERAGLAARRTMPPPAASVVYELTAASAGLTGVLAAMAQWGAQLLGAPREDDDVRPAWLILGMAVTAPASAELADAVYELRVDDETFHVRVQDGHLRPAHGPADQPDALISLGRAALLELATGGRPGQRDITILGDRPGARAFLDALSGEPASQ